MNPDRKEDGSREGSLMRAVRLSWVNGAANVLLAPSRIPRARFELYRGRRRRAAYQCTVVYESSDQGNVVTKVPGSFFCITRRLSKKNRCLEQPRETPVHGCEHRLTLLRGKHIYI